MEILTSVKETLLTLDDTPVCPTDNQESPPLDWSSTQTPTLSENESCGQIDTKTKGQEGKNPCSRNKGVKKYGKKFRCFRCKFTGHSAAQCRTDWEIIKTYQKSKQEDTDSD